jgi:hypothetical protein
MAPVSTVSRYRETNTTQCGYSSVNYGAPPTPNYAYYISFVGTVVLPEYLNCLTQRTYHKYAIRSGSISNTPVGHFFLLGSPATPIAAEEVYAPTTSEDLGNDYFGAD